LNFQCILPLSTKDCTITIVYNFYHNCNIFICIPEKFMYNEKNGR
jgi:hypothetical protein